VGEKEGARLRHRPVGSLGCSSQYRHREHIIFPVASLVVVGVWELIARSSQYAGYRFDVLPRLGCQKSYIGKS
jgi:hypothetical protein